MTNRASLRSNPIQCSGFLGSFVIFCALISTLRALPPQNATVPEVSKVEPPNWWIALTPEVLLLLYGHDLEATRVSCNLQTVRVTRTQATAGGDYLFVWLKIDPATRSGTAVCRITTPKGPTSFELPLAVRTATGRKFQGIPTNDAPPGDDSDLRTARERLLQFKKSGMTLLHLGPLAMRETGPDGTDQGVVDFYSVDPRRGSLKDLEGVLTFAHEQQMKVALDLELIHISSFHPWVRRSPLAEWLGRPLRGAGPQSQHSGSVSSSGRILDTENPLVALYLLQNTIWWTESSGVDEIRVTTNPNTTSEFWASWRAELQKIYPYLMIICDSPHLK